MTSQSRWVPSPASGLCASTRTMGISLGARWALAVAMAAAQGHGGPGEPLLLPPVETRGCHRPSNHRLSPTLLPSDQGSEGSDHVSPHTGGPRGWGAVSEQTQTQMQTGQLNTRPPASFLLASELKKLNVRCPGTRVESGDLRTIPSRGPAPVNLQTSPEGSAGPRMRRGAGDRGGEIPRPTGLGGLGETGGHRGRATQGLHPAGPRTRSH